MEILDRYSHELQQDLHSWADEHVQQNPHLFSLLDINPEKYPDQRISVHTVEGLKNDDRLPPEMMNSIATDVDPRYEGISKAVDDNDRALELIGETLESGQNVILGTDHAELIDIALLLVKVKSALLQRGYDFETSMIVNKMVTFLGINYGGDVQPATKLLRLGIEELYLNVPNTGSSKTKMTVPKKVQSAFNERMVSHGVTRRLRASPAIGKSMLLGVALSGTVNKKLDVEAYESISSLPRIDRDDLERTMVIGRANIGMLSFMEHGLTVPASAKLDGEQMSVRIDDRPLSVRSKDKLDLLMQRVTDLQQLNDPEHHYVYDVTGDLPLIRKS